MTSPPPGPGTDCDEEQLAAYGAGDLRPEERGQVAAHLLDCETCWQQSLTSRAVVAAVQRLWEPAPASLRADLRAAPTTPGRRSRRPSRPWMAAAAAVALIISGIAGVAATHHPGLPIAKPAPPAPSSAPAALPDRVQAAIAIYTTTTTMPSSTHPTTVPDLTSIGLRLSSAGVTDIAGEASTCYTYIDANNLRLGVLVTATPWPRPAAAESITAGAWATQSNGLTLIGGTDKDGDQMLIITHEHTTAMTTAAHLKMI